MSTIPIMFRSIILLFFSSFGPLWMPIAFARTRGVRAESTTRVHELRVLASICCYSSAAALAHFGLPLDHLITSEHHRHLPSSPSTDKPPASSPHHRRRSLLGHATAQDAWLVPEPPEQPAHIPSSCSLSAALTDHADLSYLLKPQ